MIDEQEHRRRIIAEVSAFINWGLAHPDQVRWIPRKRMGSGGFSRTLQRVFWHGVFKATDAVPHDVVRRFLRWAGLG